MGEAALPAGAALRSHASRSLAPVGESRAVHRAVSDVVHRTPVLTSATLSERYGGSVWLKAECLQRTGSFKIRGALHKLRRLDEQNQLERGVAAGSAGNHAQALAYAGRHCGVPCEVFMPREAAATKLAAVREYGATIHQDAGSVDECVAQAVEHAADRSCAFVHPFDDVDIIVGQAGVGIEVAEDVSDLRKVVFPVGGEGLAAGVAVALRQLRPEVELVGVRVKDAGWHGVDGPAEHRPGWTLADGIAIKRPGDLTLPLLRDLLDDVVAVTDRAIADAMVLLLERAKLMVEGAGAAPVAALLSGAVMPAKRGATAVILSGGNVDPGVLAALPGIRRARVPPSPTLG